MSKKFREKILQGSGFSNKQFECDYGLKLLKKMGWTEGNGLGKEEKGATSCIQVTRRDENLGLGVDKKSEFKWNDNWWEKSFNDALKNIKLPENHLQNQKEDSCSSESEDETRGRNIKKAKREINGYSSSTERQDKKADAILIPTKSITKKKK